MIIERVPGRGRTFLGVDVGVKKREVCLVLRQGDFLGVDNKGVDGGGDKCAV